MPMSQDQLLCSQGLHSKEKGLTASYHGQVRANQDGGWQGIEGNTNFNEGTSKRFERSVSAQQGKKEGESQSRGLQEDSLRSGESCKRENKTGRVVEGKERKGSGFFCVSSTITFGAQFHITQL